MGRLEDHVHGEVGVGMIPNDMRMDDDGNVVPDFTPSGRVRNSAHGKKTRYTLGCRCPECREAMRGYFRERSKVVDSVTIEFTGEDEELYSWLKSKGGNTSELVRDILRREFEREV